MWSEGDASHSFGAPPAPWWPMSRRRWWVSLLVMIIAVLNQAAPAVAALGWLVPPVDGPVLRPFLAPSSPYGPGHRGIDYDVAHGAGVRAAGAGTVSWAGSVAGDLSVTIDHGGGLRSTYSILSQIQVIQGTGVEQGQWIGRAGTDHRSGAGGLHFGVKLDGVYVDPMEYLGPVDLSASVHLAPVLDDPGSMQPTAAECVEPRPIAAKPPPPNDNVAVLVAGLSSATRGGGNSDLFNLGRGLLGYRPEDTYRFSYAGHGGRGRHRPYRATDTYGDILLAARRLRDLLAAIARRRPGADVDLIAHSQGGVVARLFLQRLAHPWVSDLPRVEHLVTLATPHTGAPIAGSLRDVRDKTLSGAPVLWGARRLVGGLPDPGGRSVEQLVPGSSLMRGLAREDIVYGTRALALTMPNDLVVPSDRAIMPEEQSHVLGPEGWNGHGAIVRSPAARGLAHAFLRGAPRVCGSPWDNWGRAIGRAIGFAEARLGWLSGTLEGRVTGPAGRLAGTLRRVVP